MAKWGEGDPRWIVEERADATNVNNWHWTEKNATPWSKDKLRSLLEGLVIDDEIYFCEIKELTKIDGEASANNRKAKLFFFYEWELKAEWKGKLKEGNRSYKGEIEIPNLSEEHDSNSVDINISLKDTDICDEGVAVKEFLRTKGVYVIRTQLSKYLKELREEFTQGMILPAKENDATTQIPPSQPNQFRTNLSTNAPQEESRNFVGQIAVKELNDKVEFKCTSDELFHVFLNQNLVEAFTRGRAIVQPQVGGQFSLFDGNITGIFTNLMSDKLLEMTWRFGSWPAGHYSAVRLDFDQKNDCTELTLTQTNVPASDFERTAEGWKKYYWQSIMQTFGYGAMLF